MTIEELKEVFTSDFKVKRIKHVFKAQPFNKPEEQVCVYDYDVATENHLKGKVTNIYKECYGEIVVTFEDDNTIYDDRVIIGTPDIKNENAFIFSFTKRYMLEDYHVYESIVNKGKEKRLYFIHIFSVENVKKASREFEKYINKFVTKDGNSLVVVFDVNKHNMYEELEKRGWKDRTFNPKYDVVVKRF